MSVSIILLEAGDAAILDHVADGVFDNVIDLSLTAEFLRDERHHIAVAIEDSCVIGFASGMHYVHPDKSPQLWINEVAVAPSRQKEGLGRALVEALLEKGRHLNCSEAWVLTDIDNKAARALYRAAGGLESEHIMVTFPFGDGPGELGC